MPPIDKRQRHDDFIGDVALSPDGRLIYAADLYHDSIVVINPQSGMVIERIKTGRRPYRILFHPDGKSFFVTSWADGTMGHYDTATGNQLREHSAGSASHRHALARRARIGGAGGRRTLGTARLFVAAANTNSVYAVGVNAAKEMSAWSKRINVAMTPRQPLGMTPCALAPQPDGKTPLRGLLGWQRRGGGGYLRSSAAAWRASSPRAGIPRPCALWRSERWSCSTAGACARYPNPEGPNPAQAREPVHEGVREPGVRRTHADRHGFVDPPFTDEQLAAGPRRRSRNSPYRDAKLDAAQSASASPSSTSSTSSRKIAPTTRCWAI